jgi:hypothetical protein
MPCLSGALAGPYLASSPPSSLSRTMRWRRLCTSASSRATSPAGRETLVSSRNWSVSEFWRRAGRGGGGKCDPLQASRPAARARPRPGPNAVRAAFRAQRATRALRCSSTMAGPLDTTARHVRALFAASAARPGARRRVDHAQGLPMREADSLKFYVKLVCIRWRSRPAAYSAATSALLLPPI